MKRKDIQRMADNYFYECIQTGTYSVVNVTVQLPSDRSSFSLIKHPLPSHIFTPLLARSRRILILAFPIKLKHFETNEPFV